MERVSTTLIKKRQNYTDHLIAVRSLLVSKWRQITASLLQSTYDNRIEPNDPRQRNIQELVKALNDILEPYASGHSNNERAQNLEELVKRGARFGYMLFSQPTDWTFDWNDPHSRQSGNIVVYPALVQTGDDQGRRRTQGERFTEAQAVAVG